MFVRRTSVRLYVTNLVKSIFYETNRPTVLQIGTSDHGVRT